MTLPVRPAALSKRLLLPLHSGAGSALTVAPSVESRPTIMVVKSTITHVHVSSGTGLGEKDRGMMGKEVKEQVIDAKG